MWRFDRNQVSMADRPVLIRNLLMRGMKPGFALAVVTAGECKTIDIYVDQVLEQSFSLN